MLPKCGFGDHTDALFKRHNMKSIGYWVPEGAGQNLFVYTLEHPSCEEAKKNWDAFQKRRVGCQTGANLSCSGKRFGSPAARKASCANCADAV